MVDLALLGIDFAIELERNVVISLEGVRVAREGDGLRLDVELELGGLDVRYGDCEVDEVLSFVSCARALSPEDCRAS